MFREIKNDFKFYWRSLKETIHVLRFKLALKVAIRVAIQKQSAYDKAYYVLLGPDNKPVALSRKDIRELQLVNKIDKVLPWYEILDRCLFYTTKETKKQLTKEEKKYIKEQYSQFIRDEYRKKYKRTHRK